MDYPTGIGRALHPKYPSHVFVSAVATAWGAVAFGLGLAEGFWSAVGEGVLAGGCAFLAWAIARELDPDRPVIAGVAAMGAGAASFVGEPGLAVAAAALLTTRVVVRSTGLVPTLVDVIVVMGTAVYVATRPAGFPVAIVVGLGLLADGRLPGLSANRLTIAGDLLILTATAVAVAAGTIVPAWVPLHGWDWALLGVSITGAVLVVRPPIVTANTDWTDEPIDRRRLRAARVAALAMVVGAVAWGGAVGLVAVAPVSVAMAAVLVPLRTGVSTG